MKKITKVTATGYDWTECIESAVYRARKKLEKKLNNGHKGHREAFDANVDYKEVTQ